MLRNHFIIAIRYIFRNKLQSLIQIASLTIGMAVTIQLGLYIAHELSTDRFNEHLDRIYRLENGPRATTPSAIGHQIKEQFGSEINVMRMVGGSRRIRYISDKGKVYEKTNSVRGNGKFCDSTLFDIFSFQFIKGDPKTALTDSFSVVLTESTARTLFGSEDPIGKSVELEVLPPSTSVYTVTGIVQDFPKSHLEFDYIFSITSIAERAGRKFRPGVTDLLNTYTHNFNYTTYLLLPPAHDVNETEKNLNTYFREELKNSPDSIDIPALSLRPLKEIYFSQPILNEREYRQFGNLGLLRILIIIALSVLAVASINYINITTARGSSRSREVMIRKMVGASRSRLILQFLTESLINGLISFLFAVTIVQVLLPQFNQIALTELNMMRFFQPRILLVSIAAVIVLGVTAGIYPAIALSGFTSFDNKEEASNIYGRSVMPRRILLTFQYAVSVILVICVLTILRQLRYMKSADLGFEKELVVNIWGMGLDGTGPQFIPERIEFRERLLQHPNISEVAFGRPFGSHRRSFISRVINGIQHRVHWISVDPHFIDLMELKILEGRNFSWDEKDDYRMVGSTTRILVNESYQRTFKLESPAGMILPPRRPGGRPAEIIGVIEDFHDLSLHHKIEPTFLVWAPSLVGPHIKILPDDTPKTIRHIEKTYKDMFPDFTFEYTFLDEAYDQQYEGDERLILIISNFAFVAILIACLGLFGLSFFMASRRTKEIGIRKSLGASDRTVFILLSKEFIKWVALSVVIACPVAWFSMHKFLQTYAYRTNIGIWVFVAATLMAFAISFVAVAWHAWRTARTNPIRALRYE